MCDLLLPFHHGNLQYHLSFTAPRKPDNVGANYDANTESVKVTWQPPQEFRGKILKYRVRIPAIFVLVI